MRPLALNLWFVLEDLEEEDEKLRFRSDEQDVIQRWKRRDETL